MRPVTDRYRLLLAAAAIAVVLAMIAIDIWACGRLYTVLFG